MWGELVRPLLTSLLRGFACTAFALFWLRWVFGVFGWL